MTSATETVPTSGRGSLFGARMREAGWGYAFVLVPMAVFGLFFIYPLVNDSEADANRLPGLLHAIILRSPHAHAKITKLDTSAAEQSPGFKALHVIVGEGKEVIYAGDEIVAVPADTEEHAHDSALTRAYLCRRSADAAARPADDYPRAGH